MNWRRRAACAGIADPEIFFRDDSRSVLQAKTLCASCPVRTLCLSEGRRLIREQGGDPYRMEGVGTYGGLTARELVGVWTRTPGKLRRDQGLTLLVAGYSHADIARELHVSPSTVRRWIADARRPTPLINLSDDRELVSA